MEEKNKKIITILGVLTVIFTIIGGTLAVWRWQTATSQRTEISFTVGQGFSCRADGGGNITQNDVLIVPTDCASSNAIVREIKATSQIDNSGKIIYMDLWLDIKQMGDGLSDSVNFKYALTTSSTSCTSGIISSGNFNGTLSGDKVFLLNSKEYSATSDDYTKTDTYYLHIWLDKEETSSDTMNENFEVELNGNCVETSKPIAPIIEDGLIPVKISNNGVVTALDETDNSWYNYNNQEWANAVLVKENGINSRDINSISGTIIPEDDILGYFVWLPRYKYSFPIYNKVKCSDISNAYFKNYLSCYKLILTEDDKESVNTTWYNYVTTNLDANYTETNASEDVNEALETGSTVLQIGESTQEISGYEILMITVEAGASLTGELNIEILSNKIVAPLSSNHYIKSIDIVFEASGDTYSSGTGSSGSYRTHPAFWWDADGNRLVNAGEIKDGIWVGKFETTGESTAPTIKPKLVPLASIKINTQFQTALLFNGSSLTNNIVTSGNGTSSYGLTSNVDSHMMKNSEWGAVAYLSHSIYGINQEIRINNFDGGNQTGCGGTEEEQINSTTTTQCSIPYGSGILSYPQSTTGNISGIFDMSGGKYEHVMGNYDKTVTSNDGFQTEWFEQSSNQKYYDLYSSDVFDGTTGTNVLKCTTETCGGHALYETMGWYADYASFVYSGAPWFARGGYYGYGSNAGAFYFYSGGGWSSSDGFRVVLLP